MNLRFPVQEALLELRSRVSEFNACVPYSGVSSAPAARPDPPTLQALLSLLPQEGGLGFGGTPPEALGLPGHLSSKEAIHLVGLLHCLQRLASSGLVAAAMINLPGAAMIKFPKP